MSALYNEYALNNSYNDNLYNNQLAKSASTTYKLKKILKPLLRMLKNKSTSAKKQHFLQSNLKQVEEFWPATTTYAEDHCACDDNSANEQLESRIISEIEQCPEDAGVFVYNDELGGCELQSVQRDQQFVPVHFARTNAGTFFWTTMTKEVDCDLVQPTYCCSHFQQPEFQHAGDRWVQA